MRVLTKGLSRDHAIAAIAVLLVLGSAGAYLGAMRGASDRREAALLVSQINLALADVPVSADTTATYSELRNIVYVTGERVLFFYDSELDSVLPEVTALETKAWTATCLALDLGALYERGVSQPAVGEVARVQAALQAYPEWSGIVVGEGLEARVDNTDGRAMRFLVGEMQVLQARATALCAPHLVLDAAE